MAPPTAPKFGVKFITRRERTVKRVTKYETREIQKRLEPPKPPKLPRARAPAKPKQPPPATLVKPKAPPRPRNTVRGLPVDRPLPPPRAIPNPARGSASSTRVLQTTDLEKLARLNCSREFGLFNKYIKSELSSCYEKQLAFLQTKLQHLKNEFVNKTAEHLNFEQIREYYLQAVQDNERRQIKPDEFLTLAEKLKQDTKQAIDKWLKKKEPKPQRQLTEYLQKRQARIRERIKETLEENKKRQLSGETEIATESTITTESSIDIGPSIATESSIVIEPASIVDPPIIVESVISVEMTADEIMIID